eukprot:8246310-Alexandrium_andersonii.AAC.1
MLAVALAHCYALVVVHQRRPHPSGAVPNDQQRTTTTPREPTTGQLQAVSDSSRQDTNRQ